MGWIRIPEELALYMLVEMSEEVEIGCHAGGGWIAFRTCSQLELGWVSLILVLTVALLHLLRVRSNRTVAQPVLYNASS